MIYHMGMTQKDIDEYDLSEFRYKVGWFIKQKEMEEKALSKGK